MGNKEYFLELIKAGTKLVIVGYLVMFLDFRDFIVDRWAKRPIYLRMNYWF